MKKLKDNTIKTMATLTGNNLKRANILLSDIVILFDKYNITYHLEGGTLLGLVRDNQLLPWDHDIDISIPSSEIKKLLKIKNILEKSYRVKLHYFKTNTYILESDKLRLIKVKNKYTSLLKNISPYIFRRFDVVLDIFVKYSDDKDTYWEASKKTMRVSSKYYTSYEEIEYNNYNYKVPNNYKEYLREKYGDWKTPIKEWDCSIDEKTILN
jgi:phosphorylcholine metabolism protein LicD